VGNWRVLKRRGSVLDIGLIALAMGAAAAPTSNYGAKYVEPVGIGLEGCRSWVAHHVRADQAMINQDEWLAGYLTGFNTFGRRPVRQHSFFGPDRANVAKAITASCNRNNNQTIFDAATVFVQSTQRHR
jgi:hypothetical protein